jgi:hypothetical protein
MSSSSLGSDGATRCVCFLSLSSRVDLRAVNLSCLRLGLLSSAWDRFGWLLLSLAAFGSEMFASGVGFVEFCVPVRGSRYPFADFNIH